MARHGGAWGWLAAGLLFAVGCGEAEVVDPSEGEAVRGAMRTAVETPAAPAVDPEVAALARFWAVDRFVLDGSVGPRVRDRHHVELLAKAEPDECFAGIGVQGEPAPVDGVCSQGVPKTNDAYVWGLTKVGPKLFFGTLANTNCLVEAGYLGNDTAHDNPLYVCEFGANPPYGDFRFPNLFRYDLATRQLQNMNAAADAKAAASGFPGLRQGTSGFRSAGHFADRAFVAGPARGGGIALFVFEGATDAVLAAKIVRAPSGTPQFTNIRQWATTKDALYLGVGRSDGAGAVLRWTGTDDYLFEIVGVLPSDAANMIVHSDNRLYVTTWPGNGHVAGLYRSPVIPAGGLTAAHAAHADWSKPLWLASQYDPDERTTKHYGGGALASWRGRIIFGTMHVPFSATRGAMEEYGLGEDALLQTALGTHRSIAIFEVKFPAGKPKVSMLYGEKYLPTWNPAVGGYTIRYDRAHRTGFVPRWGPSGFGNFFNSYTWTMQVLRGDLFIGTFDWSQLVLSEFVTSDPADSPYRDLIEQFGLIGLLVPKEGADVIRFDRGDGVWAESVDGMGNNRNYGIRTMVGDDVFMYFGTANPMNLDPAGGWELLKVAAW